MKCSLCNGDVLTAAAPTVSGEREAAIEECAKLVEGTALRNPANIAREIRAADQVWEALKERCASTPDKSKVKTLVTVRLEDVAAALAAAPAVGGEATAWRVWWVSMNTSRTEIFENEEAASRKAHEVAGCIIPLYAAQPASPLRGRDDKISEEMRESGTADAFEEADFAILYREIPESGTTTLQEITNVPEVFCREIARLITSSATPPEQPAVTRCVCCGKPAAGKCEGAEQPAAAWINAEEGDIS